MESLKTRREVSMEHGGCVGQPSMWGGAGAAGTAGLQPFRAPSKPFRGWHLVGTAIASTAHQFTRWSPASPVPGGECRPVVLRDPLWASLCHVCTFGDKVAVIASTVSSAIALMMAMPPVPTCCLVER